MNQLDHVVVSFNAARRGRGNRRTWRRRARRPQSSLSRHGFASAMVALPLAVFTAVFLWDGPPEGLAMTSPAPAPSAESEPRTYFETCGDGARINCVIDGDTFWYRGEKIRIADINTPEVSEPDCAREAALGAKATRRLQGLLNEGAFSLERDSSGRDTDRYGRTLRTVHRAGESLGMTLVDEGLAETWKGYRSDWC